MAVNAHPSQPVPEQHVESLGSGASCAPAALPSAPSVTDSTWVAIEQTDTSQKVHSRRVSTEGPSESAITSPPAATQKKVKELMVTTKLSKATLTPEHGKLSAKTQKLPEDENQEPDWENLQGRRASRSVCVSPSEPQSGTQVAPQRKTSSKTSGIVQKKLPHAQAKSSSKLLNIPELDASKLSDLVSKLSAKVSTLSATRSTLSSEISNLSAEASHLQEGIDSIQKQLAILQQEKPENHAPNALENSIRSLEQQKSERSEKISSLKTQITERSEKISSLESQINESTEAIIHNATITPLGEPQTQKAVGTHVANFIKDVFSKLVTLLKKDFQLSRAQLFPLERKLQTILKFCKAKENRKTLSTEQKKELHALTTKIYEQKIKQFNQLKASGADPKKIDAARAALFHNMHDALAVNLQVSTMMSALKDSIQPLLKELGSEEGANFVSYAFKKEIPQEEDSNSILRRQHISIALYSNYVDMELGAEIQHEIIDPMKTSLQSKACKIGTLAARYNALPEGARDNPDGPLKELRADISSRTKEQYTKINEWIKGNPHLGLQKIHKTMYTAAERLFRDTPAEDQIRSMRSSSDQAQRFIAASLYLRVISPKVATLGPNGTVLSKVLQNCANMVVQPEKEPQLAFSTDIVKDLAQETIALGKFLSGRH